MSSTITRIAAVAATSALALSGATAVAGAQSMGPETGALSSSTLGSTGNNGGSLGDDGSIRPPADATGQGSFDTTGSLIGEPSTGSLAPVAIAVSDSVNVSSPAPGTGSVDTTGSLIGEPTTGSLASVAGPISGSLGIDEGLTTIIGSSGSSAPGSMGSSAPGSLGSTGSAAPGSLGSSGSAAPGSLGSSGSAAPGSVGSTGGSLGALVPVIAIGGSIAAGVIAAPMISDVIANMGIVLPPLPELPAGSSIPGMPPMNQAPPAVQAPGPDSPNGRG